MVHKLLKLLTGPTRPDAGALYNEYRVILEERLAPLGFARAREEAYATGAVLTYSKHELEVGLVLDTREGECILRAESGEVRKHVDDAGQLVTEMFDVYLPLADTDESRAAFLHELDHWLRSHNAHR